VITSSWPEREYDAAVPLTATRDTVKPRRSRSNRDRFSVALAVTTVEPLSTWLDGS
jgi:hypothetical protein